MMGLYSSCVYFFIPVGLTSSFDTLLSTTTEARLSECGPIPTSQIQGSDAEPSQPVVDQKIAPADSTSLDSTLSHIQVSKGDSPHTVSSDSTHPHSRSVDKSTSTAPCDSETSSRELNQSKVQTLSTDITAKDSASVVDSSEPAYKAMIHSHDKLVTAISTDIITMSGVLLAKEFIPFEMSSKMLLPNFTEREKATILVNAVTDRINVAPKLFDELVKIFSEQICTKDIIDSLLSQVRHEQDDEDDTEDCDSEATSSSQQYAVCEGQMYTAWASLTPADKIDLEARLIDDAEAIREEFALLCWRVRDSFEQRDVKPRTLASALLDLKINEDASNGNGIPLLKEKEGALMSAKSIHDTFDVVRPHMNFFNYEILQYLIKGKGSKEDKVALSDFLKKFEEFCKRHVFEVPFMVYSNGQSSDVSIAQQKLHVKVTRHFKAALLTPGEHKHVPAATDSTEVDRICSGKLGINLEDAKNIQRKLAKILRLKPSSLFLDCISEGSIILTFSLPMCVSLAGLDHNPGIIHLSSSGFIILCGPPGKPELKELMSSGMIVGWSPPEYGCDSLAKYRVYYQEKYELETNQWQTLEVGSLETQTCIPDLTDGSMYVFKICTVSDVGTLQYSNESDPIVMSAERILTSKSHEVVASIKDALTISFTSADPHKIAFQLSVKGVILEEDR